MRTRTAFLHEFIRLRRSHASIPDALRSHGTNFYRSSNRRHFHGEIRTVVHTFRSFLFSSQILLRIMQTRFLQFHESSLHFKLPVRINLYSNFNNTKKFFYSQVALFSKKFFYEEEEEDHACVKEIRLYFHSIIESNHRFTTDLSSPLVQ